MGQTKQKINGGHSVAPMQLANYRKNAATY